MHAAEVLTTEAADAIIAKQIEEQNLLTQQDFDTTIGQMNKDLDAAKKALLEREDNAPVFKEINDQITSLTTTMSAVVDKLEDMDQRHESLSGEVNEMKKSIQAHRELMAKVEEERGEIFETKETLRRAGRGARAVLGQQRASGRGRQAIAAPTTSTAIAPTTPETTTAEQTQPEVPATVGRRGRAARGAAVARTGAAPTTRTGRAGGRAARGRQVAQPTPAVTAGTPAQAAVASQQTSPRRVARRRPTAKADTTTVQAAASATPRAAGRTRGAARTATRQAGAAQQATPTRGQATRGRAQAAATRGRTQARQAGGVRQTRRQVAR